MAMQEECFSLGEDSNCMLTITPFNKKRMAIQEERFSLGENSNRMLTVTPFNSKGWLCKKNVSHWVRIVIVC